MKIYKFSLNISADEMQRYYRGEGKYVHITGVDGHSIQFPAHNLRQFVSRNGVHGKFELKVDDSNKLIEIRQVD